MKKETRNLVIFFVATFLWTWAFYIPIVVSGNSQLQMPWMILLIGGGMGPSLVGVAMVLLTYDKEQRREYWRRCFSLRRIRLVWWLLIFLVFPAVFIASIAVDTALGGSMPGMTQLKDLMANPITWPLAAFISFMSGPWSEEFGWRGYALEPLLKRFGIIPGTIGLGVIWALWHLPLYFMSAGWHAQMGFKPAGFWTFIVFNVALSLVMTWVYLHTNRSVLSAMLLHFTSNFTAQLVMPISDRVEILRAVLLLAVGLAGCILILRAAQNQEPSRIEKTNPA